MHATGVSPGWTEAYLGPPHGVIFVRVQNIVIAEAGAGNTVHFSYEFTSGSSFKLMQSRLFNSQEQEEPSSKTESGRFHDGIPFS